MYKLSAKKTLWMAVILVSLSACETPRVYKNVEKTMPVVGLRSLFVGTRTLPDDRDLSDHFGSILSVDDYLIVSSLDGEIKIVDRNRFSIIGQSSNVGGVMGPLTYLKVDNVDWIFAPSKRGMLMAYNLSPRGELVSRWNLPVNRAVDSNVRIGPQNTLILATADETFWNLELNTGKVLWTYHRATESVSNSKGQALLVLGAKRIFIGTPDGYIGELNAVDGKLVKELKVNQSAGVRFKDLDYLREWDGKILGSTVEGGSFIFDPETFTVIRRIDVSFLRDPTECGKTMIVASLRGELVAYDRASWREIWRKKLDYAPSTQSICRGDHVLAIGTYRFVYGMNLKTGALSYRYDIGPSGGSYTDPVVLTVQTKNQDSKFYWISQSNHLHEWGLFPNFTGQL